MNIVPTTPSSGILQACETLPTPALIYDLDAIERTLCELCSDLKVLGKPIFYFAVKANRCPGVLSRLAELGLGANVASLPEIELAAAAGLRPISITTPALDVSLMRRVAADGIEVNLDNISQLNIWGRDSSLPRMLGLRLRVPLDPSNQSPEEFDGWSRFGIDATDRRVQRALRCHGLRVVRLHIHSGELRDVERAKMLAEMVASGLELFPDADTVNLGGGMTYLYSDRDEARTAWQAIATALGRCGRQLQLAVEPGMLPTVLAGYLLASVLGVGDHPSGRRLATLNASAWNLGHWSAPRLLVASPRRHGPSTAHDLAGSTCYEQDYFIRNVSLPALHVGDRVLLSSFGAYAASMARTSHGVPGPSEWVMSGGTLSPGNTV